MFELKPVTRKDLEFKRTKYDILLDQFDKLGSAGAMFVTDSKNPNSVGQCIRNAVKRNHKDHIEVIVRGNKIYLFNTILERGEINDN